MKPKKAKQGEGGGPGVAALLEEVQRLRELRDELEALRQHAEQLPLPAAREGLLFAAGQIDSALSLVNASRGRGSPLPPSVLGLVQHAISRAWAVEAGCAVGVSPLSILWGVAEDLGQACAYATDAFIRRAAASGKRPGARMLAELLELQPERSAAELRRMVEQATGRSMDASTARAVVRKARTIRQA